MGEYRILLWENLKCEICRKRRVVERNGRKLGTRGATMHICRALLMPDSLSLVWGHSVHFAKFPIPRFFETVLLQQFSSDFNQTSYEVS